MTNRSDVTDRRRTAAAALDEVGSHRSDHQRLSVQCRRSHHVAAVYDTTAGLVYWSRARPHAHGSRDFVDTAHHGAQRAVDLVDLLVAGPHADDELPAWCECGPHTLSRSELGRHIAAQRRKVRLP